MADCERVCSGGTAPGTPERNGGLQPLTNGCGKLTEQEIDDAAGKKPTTTTGGGGVQQQQQVMRSDSGDSRTEEPPTNRDDVSIKSRSLSLTSMSSLSVIAANDGELLCRRKVTD